MKKNFEYLLVFVVSFAPSVAAAKSLAVSAAADATPVFVDEGYRAKQPPPTKPKAVASPKPEVFTLKNGIEVVLVERHQLPTVSMELQLVGGSRLDPADKRGRASACTQLWGDGSDKHDKLQLAELLADIGSSLGASATTEFTSIEMATLSRNLVPTLDLFAEVLLHPGLRADELQRIVNRRRAALLAAKSNPAQVASRLIGAIAYGPANPRGWLTTDASLAALTVADCRAFADGHGPMGATLYVVGDMTGAQVTDHLERRLGGWRALSHTDAPTPVAVPMAGRLLLADVAGAEQAVVAVFHAGPARKAADFDATQVMISILSAGFSSRINLNLREKHGWAYGAGGSFGYARAGSLLAIQASVRPDATGASVTEILREMALMRQAEPTSDELQREREGAILSLPARWATGRSMGATFQSLRYYGLPLTDFDGFVARVQAVDGQAVLAAAQAHVQPTTAQVIIVGDLTKSKAQIEALLADGPLKGATVVRLDGDARIIP